MHIYIHIYISSNPATLKGPSWVHPPIDLKPPDTSAYFKPDGSSVICKLS